MSSEPKVLRRITVQWPTIVWLTIVWVLLWGNLAWGTILAGVLVAIIVSIVMPLPSIEFKGRVRPRYVFLLVIRFLYDLVVSSFQVAVQAFRLRETPRGAVVRVKLRSDSDLYLTLTSELSCLVPGSIVIEAHQVTGTLYLHILDLARYGGEAKVRRDVLDLEARVMRAFASKDELDRAGVSIRGRHMPHRQEGQS